MTTFTINLEDTKKAAALKKFLEAFEIPFTKTPRKAKGEESPYNPEFVEKILEAQREVDEGKGITVPLSELDTFLRLEK